MVRGNALTIIVAVAFRFALSSDTSSPPPQQSPMLGHRASSHTVCNPSPLKSCFIFAKDEPEGIEVLRNEGSLVAWALPKMTRSGLVSEVKSSREGPFARVSEKDGLDEEPVRQRIKPRLLQVCRPVRKTDVSGSRVCNGMREGGVGALYLAIAAVPVHPLCLRSHEHHFTARGRRPQKGRKGTRSQGM